MDHFPLLNDHLKLLVDDLEVSDYVVYDNKGFNDFPTRAGFDEAEISEGLCLGQVAALKHQPHEYASLIQSWFYWAVIHSCIQDPVDPYEFSSVGVAGRRVVHTMNLEAKLVAWAQRLENMDRTVAMQQIRNANDVLGRTIFLMKILSMRTQDPSKTKGEAANARYWEENGRTVLPLDLEFAICALGFTLLHAVHVISSELKLELETDQKSQPSSRWYTPSMLKNLLRIYKFCENDMTHFDDRRYGFITSCMAIGLRDLNRPGDHSTCTVDRCKADDIAPDAYKRVHIQSACECKSVLCDQAWQQMLLIIENDGIPLVRVRIAPGEAEDQSSVQIRVLAASQDTKYVAFSHVWAHGRGNQTGNDMFYCQWQWLQQCAQQCVPNRSKDTPDIEDPVPFWIDTFCVPRGESQHIVDLRRKSIIMMSRIYRSAEHVVVLDSALERLSTRSVLEFALRLKFCAWSRRVWTLHEGAVAKHVKIQTAHGLVSMVDIMFQMTKARYPGRDESGWHILRSLELEYIHAVLPTCIMINSFGRSHESMLEFSWTELAKRATSVEVDRYLVLGIMNQMAPQTLQALQRQEADWTDLEGAAKQKLKSFLLALKVLPQAIIFALDPRFDEDGMRWAPAGVGSEIPHMLSDTYIDHITDQGAIVSFGGWQHVSSLHGVKDSTFIRVSVDASGGKPPQVFHLLVWPTDAQRASFSRMCSLFSPSTPLAVILESVPEDGSTYTEYRRALLVEDCGSITVKKPGTDEEQTAIVAKYIGVLRVISEVEERNDDISIAASWVPGGDEQVWCVG